ncbi:MAG: aldehyde dehydrogenase, partial [Proteobacteria bacterium]
EERLSREQLCPVLAMQVASNHNQAVATANAVLRMTGAAHSAAFHTRDERSALHFASCAEAYRVVVNAPCSQGAAGYGTGLPPTFTIGTGYFGRSSVGENIGPRHLVHWTRLAYREDESPNLDIYRSLAQGFEGPLPAAPSDGVPGSPRPRQLTDAGRAGRQNDEMDHAVRAQIRQIIAEELRDILKK